MRRTREWWSTLTKAERSELVGLEREGLYAHDRWEELAFKANLAESKRLLLPHCPTCGEPEKFGIIRGSIPLICACGQIVGECNDV